MSWWIPKIAQRVWELNFKNSTTKDQPYKVIENADTDTDSDSEFYTGKKINSKIAAAVPTVADASETVKGIVEEATQAEMDAGTDTGATGARLFAVPSKIISYVSGLYATIASLVNSKKGSIDVTFDGLGNVLVANSKVYLVSIPYSGTITSWSISADVSGSVVVDVWKDTYANYPPVVGDAIFSTKPTLSSAIKNQNLAPTFVGAGATVTEGDTFVFNIDSATTVTKISISINITKS